MIVLRYVPFVIIGIITLIALAVNVKRNKFSENESLFWAIAGLVMLLSPLYMDHIDALSKSVGVNYAPSLVFALLFIYVFFLMYRQSANAHRLSERVVELIQMNAIYENELRTLKEMVEKQEIEKRSEEAE